MSENQINWQIVEQDYRAGIKSNVQIAKEHGISETAIRKKAKQYNWVKDLASIIRAKAAEKVREQEVREKFEPHEKSSRELQDEQIIEENAAIQASVITAHRKDIGKARQIAQMLFEELEIAILSPDELERFAEIRATVGSQEDGDAKVNERLLALYTKIMELPNKAGVAEKLSNTLGRLITLEREAFSIDANQNTSQTLEDFLTNLK